MRDCGSNSFARLTLIIAVINIIRFRECRTEEQRPTTQFVDHRTTGAVDLWRAGRAWPDILQLPQIFSHVSCEVRRYDTCVHGLACHLMPASWKRTNKTQAGPWWLLFLFSFHFSFVFLSFTLRYTITCSAENIIRYRSWWHWRSKCHESRVTLASHADVLRLVTRDKPKNVCVGG